MNKKLLLIGVISLFLICLIISGCGTKTGQGYASSTGVAGGSGGVCTTDYYPVCGAKTVQCIRAPCDPVYQIYNNLCLLTQDGATQVDMSLCTGSNMPPASRCTSNADCQTSQFCEKTSCDTTIGTCVTIPENCVQIRQQQCGCDGNIYNNDCERQKAKVSRKNFGPCATPCVPTTEICDKKDNDCDGLIDEDANGVNQGLQLQYRDWDKDGYGSRTLYSKACANMPGYVRNNQDCNDANKYIKPGAGC